MWPLEFTATPGTSPKFMPGGSFGKSGTESKAISGTLCCAKAGAAMKANNASRYLFIETSLFVLRTFYRVRLSCTCLARPILHRIAAVSLSASGSASLLGILRGVGFSFEVVEHDAGKRDDHPRYQRIERAAEAVLEIGQFGFDRPPVGKQAV